MEQMVEIYESNTTLETVFEKVKKDSEKLLKDNWYIVQTESGRTSGAYNPNTSRFQVMVVYRRKA